MGVLGFGEAGEEGRCLGCSRVHSEAPRGLGVSGGGLQGHWEIPETSPHLPSNHGPQPPENLQVFSPKRAKTRAFRVCLLASS